MIYTVTTLFINEKEKQILRTRTWGFFLSLDKAEEAILNNFYDIFEQGYYNYVIVEEIKEGILGKCKKIAWYKLKNKEKNILKIEKAKELSFLKRYIRFWAG